MKACSMNIEARRLDDPTIFLVGLAPRSANYTLGGGLAVFGAAVSFETDWRILPSANEG